MVRVEPSQVVVVGGGPVGLWTALQIKKRMADVRVTVYERHEVYQRSHVLRLDHWSMLLYSRINRTPSEQAFYKEVTGRRVGRVRMRFLESLYIRTNDLESALRSYALREDIALVNRRISNLAEAEALHPEGTVFIAADGAHSRLRQELLGPEGISQYDLQHVVEVKFEEAGEPRRFDIRQKWFFNRQLHFVGSDHVGRRRGDSTPVTLRLLVDSATYARLPEMSFKAPCRLDSPELPTVVRSNIEAYLRYRADELGTELVDGSCKVSKLALSMYAAKHFGMMRDGRAWFLVGDAAMGVPYFRALNCGMMLGSRLAMLMARNGGLAPERLSRLVGRLERRRMSHILVEFGIAQAKNAVFNAFKRVHSRFSKVPESEVR